MKIHGIEITTSDAVPPGEVWLVQGERRHEVYYKGDQIAHVVERPAKIVGKIVNLEAPK